MSEATTAYRSSWLSRLAVGSIGGWISDATDYTSGGISVATAVQSDWDKRLNLSAQMKHLTPAIVGSIVV